MGMFSKFAPWGLKNYSFSGNSPKTRVVLIVLYQPTKNIVELVQDVLQLYIFISNNFQMKVSTTFEENLTTICKFYDPSNDYLSADKFI